MENSPEIRNLIRENLKLQLLTENNKNERQQKIIDHIDKCLLELGNKLKPLAVENDYPYIRIHLTGAFSEFRRAIEDGRQTIQGLDEMLFNPDITTIAI